jgi:hypothetical protein
MNFVFQYQTKQIIENEPLKSNGWDVLKCLEVLVFQKVQYRVKKVVKYKYAVRFNRAKPRVIV